MTEQWKQYKSGKPGGGGREEVGGGQGGRTLKPIIKFLGQNMVFETFQDQPSQPGGYRESLYQLCCILYSKSNIFLCIQHKKKMTYQNTVRMDCVSWVGTYVQVLFSSLEHIHSSYVADLLKYYVPGTL